MPHDQPATEREKTTWERSCEWYKPEEIYQSIQRQLERPSEVLPHQRIPRDISSREFADWLTDQYRLAMNKGMELERRATPPAPPCEVEIAKVDTAKAWENAGPKAVEAMLNEPPPATVVPTCELPNGPGVWMREGQPWLVYKYDNQILRAKAINIDRPNELLGPVNEVRFQLPKGHWSQAVPSEAGEVARPALKGVQGALCDAADVLAFREDNDYGASVRQVVEQRDKARDELTAARAEIESLKTHATADGAMWLTAGEFHALRDALPDKLDTPCQVLDLAPRYIAELKAALAKEDRHEGNS